jgi:hypothetical protein
LLRFHFASNIAFISSDAAWPLHHFSAFLSLFLLVPYDNSGTVRRPLAATREEFLSSRFSHPGLS